MDHPSPTDRPYEALLQPEEHVLSTLEKDGSRRWLQPRLSKGRLLNNRRAVAYALLGLYTALPFVHIGGEPAVLLDIPARRFTIFGFTFLPTDTALLALSLVGVLLAVFMLTALVGRVWCGWACPQTVYLEFIFRPIERLFDKTTGRGGAPRKPPSTPRVVGKYLVYAAICFFIANTFLAYFVGVKTLGQWMTQSPFEHPGPFLIMAFVTGSMLFDFAYFREQMCILVCPYGRLQSVLLDRDSLIVSYDAARGEPRGKATKKPRKALPIVGDCVDCRLCVQTCPTGIDIRDGLQMECVNCAQCIDACGAVMHKLGRKPDLIRYSSQARDAGERGRLVRARTIIYPTVLAVIATLFALTLAGKQSFDAVLLRNPGQPFTMSADGDVRNVLRLKLTNRSGEPLGVDVEVVEPSGVEVTADGAPLSLEPDATTTFPLTVLAPPGAFDDGQAGLKLELVGDDGSSRTVGCKLLGPARVPAGGMP